MKLDKRIIKEVRRWQKWFEQEFLVNPEGTELDLDVSPITKNEEGGKKKKGFFSRFRRK